MSIKTNSIAVIVAGGRDFDDYNLLEKTLDILLKNFDDITIISGTAKGADSLGEVYAKKRNYGIIKMSANWDKYGKRAGYLRNSEMASKVKEFDNYASVCFWDGKSKGTKHMIDISKSQDIDCYIINY